MNLALSDRDCSAYWEALAWLEGFIRPISGTAPPKTRAAWRIAGAARLAQMDALLSLLQHPERRYATLHVTGTSGKGSVCTFLGAILTAAGLRTGVHTSPYLQSASEKLQVDGRYALPEEFAATVAALRDACAAAPAVLQEIAYPGVAVALAYLHFARQQVEAAVIEASVGGRYDWTNTLQPSVAVITTVGLDHLMLLGPTLADVAFHKAGVIRSQRPAVTGVHPPSLAVLEREARAQGSRLTRLGQEFDYVLRQSDHTGTAFDYRGHGRNLLGLQTRMLGRHQAFNAALAIAAIDACAGEARGIGTVSDQAIRKGIRDARMPGRMEWVQNDPDVLLDGAHNPEKAATLVESLRQLFPDRRLVLVLGALGSKDIAGVLAPFAAQTRLAVLTAPHVHGKPAADPDQLAQVAGALGVATCVEADPAAAVRLALQEAGTADLVCVTGSLYLVGEVRRLWVPDQQVLTSGSSWLV